MKPRNGVIRALVEQGNIRRLMGKTIAPKRGKKSVYDRRSNKKVDSE